MHNKLSGFSWLLSSDYFLLIFKNKTTSTGFTIISFYKSLSGITLAVITHSEVINFIITDMPLP